MAVETVIVKVKRLVGKQKAVAAGLTAFGLALASAATDAISTGNIDVTQTRIALGGLVGSVVVAGVTYIVGAGDAEVAVADVTPAPVPPKPPVV